MNEFIKDFNNDLVVIYKQMDNIQAIANRMDNGSRTIVRTVTKNATSQRNRSVSPKRTHKKPRKPLTKKAGSAKKAGPVKKVTKKAGSAKKAGPVKKKVTKKAPKRATPKKGQASKK